MSSNARRGLSLAQAILIMTSIIGTWTRHFGHLRGAEAAMVLCVGGELDLEVSVELL